MLNKFQYEIQKKIPSLKDKKLLVAISGGIDSVVLTYLLNKLKYNLALIHCNFRLRDTESDKDELFVKTLGNNLDLDVFATQFNTLEYAKKNKMSIQLAARTLRYEWFEYIRVKEQYDYILTAHHADDNLETFIINLSRGTGIDGLCGIPKQNGVILRPLLQFFREEIEVYAVENKISWREDKSNADTKYLRNKIRHQIIPNLKELNTNFLGNFSETIEYLKDSKSIVDDSVHQVKDDVVSKKNNIIQIDIEKLLNLSNSKTYLYYILKPYGVSEWEDVFNLLKAQSGKKIITNTHIILKDRTHLLVSSKLPDGNEGECYYITKETLEINVPLHLRLKLGAENQLLSKKCIQIDGNLLNSPLVIRKKREGDFFYPTKMKGKKKISKYFKDEKMSQFDKDKVWLLCSGDDIVWIIGLRQDRRFLPKENKNRLIIKVL